MEAELGLFMVIAADVYGEYSSHELQQPSSRRVSIVDLCNFVRHRWPSRLAEDGGWWLRFPSVFSEDEMMWTDANVDCKLWIMIVGPPDWQRMGDGGFASPLYSVRMKRCVWITLVRALVTMALKLAH